MARRVAVSTLNASTIDILNTIRANATYEYQSMVPTIDKATDIPKVGEVLYGYPALANQFVSALVNRIALVRVKSAVFNNPYKELKKGYLEFGETVEEIFTAIAKVRTFSAEKAESRELKRTLPDVRTAFHAINWRVQYPVTIQNEDLRMAFTSIGGVQELIAKIVDAVYTAAEYDEYLLFKYLIIKAVSHGKMKPVEVDATKPTAVAEKFRAISNRITLMSDQFTEAGVRTTTPRDDQFLFLDAAYDATFDVNVLASAFNMEKADFLGHRLLIDDWTTFDNDRFADLASESDMIEPVTAAELALMKSVKGVLVDREWFQMYDNENNFTEKYVSSGMYWNYFYNVWKTVSTSPFSSAIVFVAGDGVQPAPDELTAEIVGKDIASEAVVMTLAVQDDAASLAHSNVEFIQGEQAISDGIAIHKYGTYIFGDPSQHGTAQIDVKVGDATYRAVTATGGSTVAKLNATTDNVGKTFILRKTSLLG